MSVFREKSASEIALGGRYQIPPGNSIPRDGLHSQVIVNLGFVIDEYSLHRIFAGKDLTQRTFDVGFPVSAGQCGVGRERAIEFSIRGRHRR